MLRVFKPQSAMSVGSWTLAAFSASSTAAVLPVRAIAASGTAASGLLGCGMLTYTGVLIGATAIPVWHEHVRTLPIHFAASGMASAAALLTLMGHDDARTQSHRHRGRGGRNAIGATIELRTDPPHRAAARGAERMDDPRRRRSVRADGVHRLVAAPGQRVAPQLAADGRGRPAERPRDRPQAQPLGLERGQPLPSSNARCVPPDIAHPGLPFTARALPQGPGVLRFTPDSAIAFAKGVPLLEVPGYKVHASRRDAPGEAEVHLWETDLIYVVDGEATLVTGGTMVGPRETEPGQSARPRASAGWSTTSPRATWSSSRTASRTGSRRSARPSSTSPPSRSPPRGTCREAARLTLAGTAALLLGTAATALAAPVSLVAPEGKPAAIVDLRTEDGVRLVGAAWRYADAHLVEVAARAAGPDMRPSGPEVRATDIEPKAGPADFQDASWDEVPPAALEARRGNSRLSFGWYRVRVTVPDHIGGFDPTGSTLVLDTVLDDYAEVWVDGRLPLALGQNGGQAIAGFNAPRADCGSVRGRVAGEAEPAAGILGGDGGERRAEGGLQGLLRAGADRPQPGLELGPGLLDRVHVRRVGRQVAVAQAGAVERLAHLLGLVGAEVVHHHERVGPLAQRRDQDLLGEGEEDRRAGRGGDAPAGDQAVERERADHGQPLPPPPGHLAHGALPLAARA